jgi:hypothetical protein
VWWSTPVIPATQEAEVGGSWSEAGPGKNIETLSEEQAKKQKIWRCGSSGRVLAMQEVLSSVPSTGGEGKKITSGNY